MLNEVFDLFVSLDANTQQLDFPVLYASGRSGWCVNDLSDDRSSLTPLLNKIISHVPSPDVDNTRPFAMLSTLLDYDPYLGRCLIGRVEQGSAKINDSVHALNLSGKIIETGRLTKLLKFEGTKKITVNSVNTGDIVCIAGLSITSVSDTICSTDIETPIKSTPIDPPTMSINIMVNDSPLANGESLTIMFIDIVGGSIGVDFIGVSISVEQMVSDTDVIDKPAMQTISPVFTELTVIFLVPSNFKSLVSLPVSMILPDKFKA